MNLQQTILYEQPINEQLRLCLRLEQLFDLIDFFNGKDDPWYTRSILDAIVSIVSLIERPDLKSLFTKELSRYHATLVRLIEMPHIDHIKLRKVLTELETMIALLGTTNGKLAYTLREDDFLNVVKMYHANPGGICHFDVPGYHFWLQQPYKYRSKQITRWLQELEVLNGACRLLLRLVRDSNAPEEKTAIGGLYQMALEPKFPCHLIRVILENESHVYPEVSVGRHRVYIRFFSPNPSGKPLQTNDDVLFKLVCCML
jgi:cell division protein ZapD